MEALIPVGGVLRYTVRGHRLPEELEDVTNGRLIEGLEDRRMLAGDGAVAPYNPYQGKLVGQFVSKVPRGVIGGSTIPVALKVTNTTTEAQQGLIDLTFVLDKLTQSAGSDGVVRNDLPRADKFDPVLVQRTNVMLDLKPKGSQIFRFNATVPVSITQDLYWVAVAIDQGGFIAAGRGFGATIGAAVTVYSPGFTDVTARNFSISLKKQAAGVTGSVRVALTNFGNMAATGNVTVKVYAAARNMVSSTDAFISQQTVTLENLKPGKNKSLSIAFDKPSALPAGNYFIRIEIVRTGLPNDRDSSDNRNLFTRKTVPLS